MTKVKYLNVGSTNYEIRDPYTDTAANTTSVAERDSSGNLNAVAFNLCTVSTSTAKAKIQYDTTNDCVKFVF